MVPSGWVLTTFDKHIDLLSGFAFKSSKYSSDNNDIRLLRGDNIAQGYLRWRGTKYWALKNNEQLDKYLLEENDLVIAMDRTWITAGLKIAEVKKYDLPCLLVQRVSRIKAKASVEQSILRQYFSSWRFEQYVKSVQTETAVPHISAKQIKEFTVALPPLPEQRKIAKILSTWDKAITTTEKLITNSQQQKKALMQQLLTGKKRLNGYTAPWKTIDLKQIGKCITGLTYQPKDTVKSDGILVLRSSNIQNYRLTYEDNVYVNKNTKIKFKTEENDILVCVRNGSRHLIGKSVLLHGKAVGQAHGAFMTVFRGSYPRYIVQCFQSPMFFRQVNRNLGATINSINSTDLIKFKFPFPTDSKEICTIATVLTNADREIELLQQQLAHLQQEKKALMQQLLTGKKRVKIDH